MDNPVFIGQRTMYVESEFTFRYPLGMKPGEKLWGKISYSLKAKVNMKVSVRFYYYNSFEHPVKSMRRFARFDTICTIFKKHKTAMQECYFQYFYSLTLLK